MRGGKSTELILSVGGGEDGIGVEVARYFE